MIDVNVIGLRDEARRYEVDFGGSKMRIKPEIVSGLLDRLEAAEQREQALAAHVERLREYFKRFANQDFSFDEWRRALAETPDVSLASRDLRKQAEVLEKITADMRAKGKSVATLEALDAIADKRRRQASGESS